jgi:carboxymethylenebutenolidase
VSALTRRAFVASSVAAGFALAVRPISAGTISTDSKGLDAGDVSIPTADRSIPGYAAKPKNVRNVPVVLVVQEIFGVHEYIRDVCRRIAKLGWMAIAPDLYVRQGDPTKLTSIDEIRPLVARVPDAQVMADLDATAAFAGKNGGDPKRLGITGFCWGGRIVWLYAAHSPALRAGVAWYGRLVGEADPLHPKHPIDVAGALRAPVLGLYGGADTGIPPDTVANMRAALADAQSAPSRASRDLPRGDAPSEIVVYPSAPHGFHADYRPSYVAADAKDGWRRLEAWFRRHLTD